MRVDCIFCKIINGDIPCKKIYEDEHVLLFHDIEPQSPVHFLAIPKLHVESAAQLGEEHGDMLGRVFSAIAKAAAELGLDSGFRIVTNCGKDAQQSVQHLHFHVLGGRQLAWPPG